MDHACHENLNSTKLLRRKFQRSLKILEEKVLKGDHFIISNLLPEIILRSKEKELWLNSSLIWRRYGKNWRPTLNCICETKCSYDLINNVVKHKDSEYVMYFLKCLNDVYINAKTQIWNGSVYINVLVINFTYEIVT